MSEFRTENSVYDRRKQRGWSQAELAQRAEIPRTTVSAIEGGRLTPAVTAALALAHALECSVEELFGNGSCNSHSGFRAAWAWKPRGESCRYWEAEVNGRRLLYPVESISLNVIPHDGVWQSGVERDLGSDVADRTLILACCDPAAGLLAAEYARKCGFRLIVYPRSSAEAVDLLRLGRVHVAGLHRSTKDQPDRNAETIRAQLGNGFQLIHAAQWQEGLVLRTHGASRSVLSASRTARRWALREEGSAARECLTELRSDARGRIVPSHTAVAEAVRDGWADAGICVQIAADEASLSFLPVRTEALDFCFASNMLHDARLQALIRLLRNRQHRQLVSELPGYNARQTGELISV